MVDLLQGHGPPPVRKVPAGNILHHVHQNQYPWHSFNPASRGRYSLANSRHRRAAFYAAASPAGALLEAIGRDRDANATGAIHIPRAVRQRWRLVQFETREDLHYLEISNATVRSLSSDARLRAIWKVLGTTTHYGATQEAGAQLMDAFPDTAAFGWFSAQSNPERIFLLHSPPWERTRLRKLASCSVDSAAGRAALAAACRSIGYDFLP